MIFPLCKWYFDINWHKFEKRWANIFQIYPNAIHLNPLQFCPSMPLLGFPVFCLSSSIILNRYFHILVNSMTIWSVLKLPKIAWPSPFKFTSTHLYTWVERGTVRVQCLAQEQVTQCPLPGLETSPLDLETRTLKPSAPFPKNDMKHEKSSWDIEWMSWASEHITHQASCTLRKTFGFFYPVEIKLCKMAELFIPNNCIFFHRERTCWHKVKCKTLSKNLSEKC